MWEINLQLYKFRKSGIDYIKIRVVGLVDQYIMMKKACSSQCTGDQVFNPLIGLGLTLPRIWTQVFAKVGKKKSTI